MLGRLAVVRYAGLVGAVLLAAGAYRAGALPGAAGQPSGVRSGALGSAGYAVAFAACVLGLLVLSVAWWRLRSVPEPPGPRWVLTTGALWAAPVLFAPPLGSRDVYAYACQGWLWSNGGDPYRVGVASGGCPWLDSVPPLWRDSTTPYGPLAILVSGGAASAGDQRLAVVVTLLRLVALGGAVLVAWQGTRLARACGVRPADAAWLAVLAPLAVLHVASGAHHDALVAGLVVAALAQAVHRRGYAAGALIGLAAAVKVTALVVLPFAALLLAGAARPAPRLARAGAVAAGAAVVAFGAVTVAAGLGLGWTAALTGTAGLKQWTSPPTAVGMAVGYLLRALGWAGGFDAAVAAARVLGLLVLAAVLVALWLHAASARNAAQRSPAAGADGDPARAGDTARTVAACGWALAAVVLLAPVLYPWYALVPAGVLAAALPPAHPGRRAVAVGVLVAAFLVFPDGLGVAVLTKLPGAFAVVALLVVSAWLIRRRVRARVRPGPAR